MAATLPKGEEARICEPGGRGLVFPLLEGEQEWNRVLRGILYALALIYLFLGVNIVADKFVGAIETITSSKRRVRQRSTGRLVTVAVWNDTVANLTLLALGSSAPEILLSVVETVRNNFHSGELGPSTIIGSAAFNLFMIIAVCIMAIPSTEMRAIKETSVFAITAVFSLLAYAWLVFIVQISSPDIVDIWEAVLTLALLPVLIYISYAADVGLWPFPAKARGSRASLVDTEQPAVQDSYQQDYGQYYPNSYSGGYERQQYPHAGYPQHPPPPGGGVSQLLGTGEWGAGSSHQPCGLLDAQGRPLGSPAGVITFAHDTWEVSAGLHPKEISVPVHRVNCSEGTVACKYRTESYTAVPGYDYVEAEGELVFEHGDTRAEATVTLLGKRLGEHSDQFQIVLEDAEGGAIFNPYSDGGEERCVVTVTILNENDGLVDQSAALQCGRCLDSCLNLDSFRRGNSDWYSEVLDSIFEVGSEEGESPNLADWVMHLSSMPWKFLFAVLVPPPAYFGGWLSFSLSLAYIGGLTAIVIDFAELFGCVTNIEDSITAITFVALGTSMPDLFASVSSAKADETADASIVNVTGSNSVNVFVGIGVPWTMAAIYWQVQGPNEEWLAKYGQYAEVYPNGGFIVPGGDLGFGVVVFTVAALMALALIRLRRVKLGGELGGPFGPKVLSALMLTLLWLFYIGLFIWKVAAQVTDFWSQVGAIFIGVMVLENLMLLACFFVYACSGSKAWSSPQEPAEEKEWEEEGGEWEEEGGAAAKQPEPPLPPPPPLGGNPQACQPPAHYGVQCAADTAPQGPRFAGYAQRPAAAAGCASTAGNARGECCCWCGGALPSRQAGIVDSASMLSAESLVPVVSVEAISKAISFTGAAMVCLAANRLKRPVRRNAHGGRRVVPAAAAAGVFPPLQRPAGLPPELDASGVVPPAPATAPPALQRSDSFYSVSSSGVPGYRSCGMPSATTTLTSAPFIGQGNGGSGPVGVVQSVQSVGGRVAGWVGEHRADCLGVAVAGLAAAQLA